jgi:hypothetical protein
MRWTHSAVKTDTKKDVNTSTSSLRRNLPVGSQNRILFIQGGLNEALRRTVYMQAVSQAPLGLKGMKKPTAKARSREIENCSSLPA